MPAKFQTNDDTYRVPLTSLGERSQKGIESIRGLLGVDWEDEVTVTPVKIGNITVEAHIRLQGVGPDGELIEMISRPSEPGAPKLYVDGVDTEWGTYKSGYKGNWHYGKQEEDWD